MRAGPDRTQTRSSAGTVSPGSARAIIVTPGQPDSEYPARELPALGQRQRCSGSSPQAAAAAGQRRGLGDGVRVLWAGLGSGHSGWHAVTGEPAATARVPVKVRAKNPDRAELELAELRRESVTAEGPAPPGHAMPY